jgi:nicotinamidase/pyrazinamidase
MNAAEPVCALILVDCQADFVPGGALPVPDGDAVVGACNELRAAGPWRLIVLTQDWHPSSHASFAVNNGDAPLFSTRRVGEEAAQVMWPVHCVEGTPGAAFLPSLAREPSDVVVRKGTVPAVDSYSGFGDAFGGKYERTALAEELHAAGVSTVVLGGLALDYCVAYTALDAAAGGFRPILVLDACRGIAPASVEAALASMDKVGVVIVRTVEEAIVTARSSFCRPRPS